MTSVTIAESASLSSEVRIPEGMFLAGIQIPSVWTSANITFQASIDGATYTDVYEIDGSELMVTVGGASRMVVFGPQAWPGFRFIKLRSGTTATPVVQAAARTLNLAIANFS